MASLEKLKSVDIPPGSVTSSELKDYLNTKALAFFNKTNASDITSDNWALFSAVVATLYTNNAEINNISKGAVDQMCATMADNKIEEITAAKSAQIASLIETLQTFCDSSELTEVDKADVSGILRAISIMRKLI